MAQEEIQISGSLDRPEDAGKGPAGVVARWLMELDISSKEEQGWRKAALKTIERYRDEERRQRVERKGSSRFNILWANTEIMRPSLYSSTPRPDVRRRRNQKDEQQDTFMRAVAEGIERAAAYTVDHCDLDYAMDLAVTDYLLAGRSVTRVRYTPTIEDEYVVWEKVEFEHVQWDRFRRGPGGHWKDVPWVAFEHLLRMDEMEERFGRAARRVKLDIAPATSSEEGVKDEEQLLKRGRVWEIWDRVERKVIHIAPSVKDAPLLVEDDPLQLRHFFPIPRPMYATGTSDTLIPIEGDRQYRDQIDELDQITHRIRRLTAAMKVRGIYDATISEMARVIEGDDNELIPSEGAQNILTQTGTLERHVWLMPVDMLAKALAQLYIQRDQIKQTIYEITGLSDILRGATDANETLGAQQLKAQTGSLRLQRRQREVQRYARDLIEMACEIMAEHFQPETLSLMIGEPVSPEALQVLRNQGLRDFSVNVETDSTISVDQQQDQEAITTLLEGITAYMTAVAPAVQSGLLSGDAAKALLMAAVRRFRLGREVEETLEMAGGQQQMDPMMLQQMQEQAMMAAEQAVEKDRVQVQAEQAKVEQARSQIDSEVEKARSQIDAEVEKVASEAKRVDEEQKRWKEQQQMIVEKIKLDREATMQDFKEAMMELERRKMEIEKIGAQLACSEDEKAEAGKKDAAMKDLQSNLSELPKAVSAMAEAIAQGAEMSRQAQEQMLAVLSAEKELVRDKSGRPVGSRVRLNS